MWAIPLLDMYPKDAVYGNGALNEDIPSNIYTNK